MFIRKCIKNPPKKQFSNIALQISNLDVQCCQPFPRSSSKQTVIRPHAKLIKYVIATEYQNRQDSQVKQNSFICEPILKKINVKILEQKHHQNSLLGTLQV